MLAITCDLCGMAITERACLIDIIEARMVMTADSRPRVTERGGIILVEACEVCGRRVLRLLDEIRERRLEREQLVRK